ncbi:reverse transcriptase domain-containing protein [Tanacetum coccineum]
MPLYGQKEGIVLAIRFLSLGRVDKSKVDSIAKIASSHYRERMKLTQAPILVAPDWDLPFEIMCDASDFAVGAVLGQRVVFRGKKLSTFSKLATGNTRPGDTTVPITPLKRIFDSVSMPSIYNDPTTISPDVDICQRQGKFARDEKPQNTTKFAKSLTCGIDFMGRSKSIQRTNTYSWRVDYLSKWVDAKAVPTIDAQWLQIFLKSLLCQIRAPRQ